MTRRPEPVEQVTHALEQGRRRVRLGATAPAHTVRGSQSSLWDTITKLRAQARREILSFDDTSYLLAHDVPDPIQRRGPATLRAALGRGARVRQVTSRAGLLADQQLGAIVYRSGGEARVVDAVPLKVSIIDRHTVLLPLNSTVLADGFQIVQDPSVVGALVAVHQHLWNAGTDPEGIDRDLPPPHLAVILPALASGAPDEVAAPRLGLSPRTYSRRVAELLKVLGVHSRFQAGAEAIRRGWL
ncbi:response regulator transcription factor [Kribbella capetownensis]|uniref:Response regulator transcription factor n=1 Tax=Kribbella capetownensis TaxID=1572659 RepID=A0A4R0JFY6_9ACTN|nr:response regulator transcription factor [Kribbella capetownensis]TCC44980.1 response regulator transcription factor [Kribbella capetownensis]